MNKREKQIQALEDTLRSFADIWVEYENLKKRVNMLEDALKPFAKIRDAHVYDWGPEKLVYTHVIGSNAVAITFGDVVNAHIALNSDAGEKPRRRMQPSDRLELYNRNIKCPQCKYYGWTMTQPQPHRDDLRCQNCNFAINILDPKDLVEE
jgi:hypothetical protein